MDKIVKRTVQAEKQVSRRLRLKATKEYRTELRDRVRRVKAAVEDLNKNIHNSRRVRHERWELGPIAPSRRTDFAYGVALDHVRTARQSSDLVYRSFEREARCAWAGGSEYLNLAVGDRVVITEGHDKGNLDVIEAINVSTGTVELKEFGKLVARSPDWLVGKEIKDGQKYPEQSVSTMPIPISAIRLVHPITDPATGITRDVIVRTLKHANVRRDRLTRTKEWDRYVPGLNVIIPWPEKVEPQEESTPADTPRKDVQEATFVPSLLSPPMPEALVNELRNRYSRFRTRHEEWYLQKKQAEADAKKAEKQVAESMLTPVQEFTRQRRQTRKALGQPKLSDAMLEKIGSVMLKNSKVASLAPNQKK